VRYRVEQLAAAADVSVDTVRYYQSLGLVPAPGREGRIAWYGDEHLERIREVRSLQRRGLTLAAVGRLLAGELTPADADLAAAIAAARTTDEAELLTLDQFAAASGVPASLIEAVEREGIHVGQRIGGDERYTADDIELVRRALRLLELGLPLGDLLSLAREANEALVGLAERAVDLFDEHVRKPIHDTAPTEDEAAEQMVASFRELLPVVTDLVSRHFRRVLLEIAEERIESPDESAGNGEGRPARSAISSHPRPS
jgi:DNA-binding transcriptional MerR regulator